MSRDGALDNRTVAKLQKCDLGGDRPLYADQIIPHMAHEMRQQVLHERSHELAGNPLANNKQGSEATPPTASRPNGGAAVGAWTCAWPICRVGDTPPVLRPHC